MKCKNCGKIVSGNFCSHCGQDTSVSKITASKLLNELSESVFQLNRGLLFTLNELFTRPGKSIQEFLEGKRKNHVKPIAYVLFLSTLYFLISQVTHQNTWINDIISGYSLGAQDKQEVADLPNVINWLANNYAYTTLLLIPLFSYCSYLSFKKFEPNYLEHIVLNCYTTGQQAIMYSCFALFISLTNWETLQPIFLFIVISYNFWVFSQFFQGGNSLSKIFRSIMTYVLYLILGIGLLSIILTIKELI